MGAAISIKVTSSIDDILWLAPFLTNNESKMSKLTNAGIYITVCMVQTFVAMVLAASGDAFVRFLTRGQKDAWSSEKILTVGAGLMLAVYSVKLWHEYFTDDGDDDQKDGADAAGTSGRALQLTAQEDDDLDLDSIEAQKVAIMANVEEAPDSTACSTEDSQTDWSDDNEESQMEGSPDSASAKSRSQTLFVIAFLGSVDDLTLFVPMLVGKGFDMVQLFIGGLTAASGIVLVCTFIGLCQPVADCLAKIPLGAIVVCFATMLLTKGFFME